MKFYKYHALGNDYLVMNPAEIGRDLTTEEVIRICHRNFGVGSDGILWGPTVDDLAEKPFALKIYNPDGSIAEKSGNGLRIYSRYLWDHGYVGQAPFQVYTDGGLVTSQVHGGGRSVTVEMGKVTFQAAEIPVGGDPREVLEERFTILGQEMTYNAASIGNPHCVLVRDDVSAEEARRLGPVIEVEPRFPNRTNVQFLKVIDRNNIKIEIWERGAGYTLASGSSSSAAAAVAHRLDLCGTAITVHMPGGQIGIEIGNDFAISMVGGVTRVADGVLYPEMSL